ncbi:MAG: hypothetical protein HY882_05955 [Deltaproteobacteria bacterium]|nr:hypothetical protein [Deltaproteobacteria bacterium]
MIFSNHRIDTTRDDKIFAPEAYFKESGINIPRGPTFSGILRPYVQAEKYEFAMDQRRKRADQELLKALIFVCAHFNHLRPPRGFFNAPDFGGDFRPKKNPPESARVHERIMVAI